MLMKLEDIFTCIFSKIKSFFSHKGSGNLIIWNFFFLNKVHVKLSSDFTQHHLITHTYFRTDKSNHQPNWTNWKRVWSLNWKNNWAFLIAQTLFLPNFELSTLGFGLPMSGAYLLVFSVVIIDFKVYTFERSGETILRFNTIIFNFFYHLFSSCS